MKGIVFSEFVEMVEEKFSVQVADAMILDTAPASGGAYTAVGTYDHRELLAMVEHLSLATGIATSELVRTLGSHLAQRFDVLYPQFFANIDGLFEFLETIEEHVHVEVRKLYPEAELPTFETRRDGQASMSMTYRSSRPFADLAEGLIEGCATRFGEKVEIARTDHDTNGRYVTTFELTRCPR
ncbi:MAG: heme NO-binding domain-containing protein [Gammaproteobacteria bacterium]|nr:heme NO-binding domain-containing protein [Gammaproteobacteria bacterium]